MNDGHDIQVLSSSISLWNPEMIERVAKNNALFRGVCWESGDINLMDLPIPTIIVSFG